MIPFKLHFNILNKKIGVLLRFNRRIDELPTKPILVSFTLSSIFEDYFIYSKQAKNA